MTTDRVEPLGILLQTHRGKRVPLPARLQRLYGDLRLSVVGGAPHIFSNFVTSLDGVVSLNRRGHEGGGDISGFSIQDRMVMGLLRAVADVVVLGSGSIGADPKHLWSAAAICPEFAVDYQELEPALKKREPALSVIVSASGSLNLRALSSGSRQMPLLVVTTMSGEKRMLKQRLPDPIQVRAVRSRGERIEAASILEAIDRIHPMRRVLVEGGPRLLGAFYRSKLVDEQFLSLSAQIAGRMDGDARPSLVMGHSFAPQRPLWGTLHDVRQGKNLLFLRYIFQR